MADETAALSAALEKVEQLRRERDFLVEEYERAVGCGSQGYLHAAMHLFNAITNAQIDAKIAASAALATAVLEYIAARDAYEAAIRPPNSHAPAPRPSHGNPVVARYREARAALLAAAPETPTRGQ